MELSQRLIREAIKRAKDKKLDKVKLKDLVVSSAIAHDKVYPAVQTQEVSIGKKQLNITMSKWPDNPFIK
jgi:hypothetical protein